MVVRSEPHQCKCYIPPSLVHPAVKWVHSVFKARVDKTTDCGDYNKLPVVAQVGLRVPTPLKSGAVSSPASTRPGYSSLFCAGPSP